VSHIDCYPLSTNKFNVLWGVFLCSSQLLTRVAVVDVQCLAFRFLVPLFSHLQLLPSVLLCRRKRMLMVVQALVHSATLTAALEGQATPGRVVLMEPEVTTKRAAAQQAAALAEPVERAIT